MEKPRYILGVLFVLLIFVTITTAVSCKLDVVGFTPSLKEDNVDKLLELILHEADLIKLAAYEKLRQMSESKDMSLKEERIMVQALIKSSIELIKYFGTCTNVKATQQYSRGRSNVNKCLTIMPQGQGGVCYKFRAMLTQAYFFTHRIKTHRAMRWWFLNPDKRKAFEMLGNDDAELNFFDIKLSCEFKFYMENDPWAFSLWVGGTKKERAVDCVTELLRFQDNFNEVGSYAGEYYYLLGRAYKSINDFKSALKYLLVAIQSVVYDNKSRLVNRLARKLFAKLYFQELY